MNEQELSEIHGTINDFHKLVLSDIANTNKVAPMASLILMLCAIDYLKSFRFGLKAIDSNTYKLLADKYPSNQRLKGLSDFDVGKWFKSFLSEYLSPIDVRYNVNDIYSSLRCGLVHNYSDRIFKYHFIDNRSYDKSFFHLILTPNNLIYFNIDVFYLDFLKMCRLFFEEALKKEEILRNIFDFRSFVGFLHA